MALAPVGCEDELHGLHPRAGHGGGLESEGLGLGSLECILEGAQLQGVRLGVGARRPGPDLEAPRRCPRVQRRPARAPLHQDVQRVDCSREAHCHCAVAAPEAEALGWRAALGGQDHLWWVRGIAQVGTVARQYCGCHARNATQEVATEAGGGMGVVDLGARRPSSPVRPQARGYVAKGLSTSLSNTLRHCLHQGPSRATGKGLLQAPHPLAHGCL
mmetsp:Transcript_18394/g.50611  ORF Transcript_18394/g.50611 Transcript_18394/m.50611 type:complete len:216 (+) Transcript_18394:164-811(+)